MELKSWNASELAARAAETTVSAHRDLPRPVLEGIVRGDPTVVAAVEPRRIDKLRLKIMEYVLDNWEHVSPLLSCPARERTPTACFACTDVQAAECVLTNPQVVDHVHLGTHQREAEETMSTPFEFHTKEEWEAIAADGTTKKQLIDALKAAKIPPADWLAKNWPTDKRIEAVLEFQTKNGWGGGKGGAKAAAKVAAKPAAATKTATPAAKEEKVAAKPAAAEGGKPASTLLLEKMDALSERLDTLEAAIASQQAMVTDTHYMVRLLLQNAGLLEDASDASVIEANVGQLLTSSGEEAPTDAEVEGNDD